MSRCAKCGKYLTVEQCVYLTDDEKNRIFGLEWWVNRTRVLSEDMDAVCSDCGKVEGIESGGAVPNDEKPGAHQ